MSGVVLFAIGSTIVVDVEESLMRAGIVVLAGIRNREGPNHLSCGAPVLGTSGLAAPVLSSPYLVPLFTPAHRRTAATEAAALGFTSPCSLVDASVARPRSLELGAGSYVNVGCSLGGAVALGRFCFVNRGATIGHHTRLSDFVSIGPGAVLAGHVAVGMGASVLAGATVLPGVRIGEAAQVAAGAVVRRDVPDRALVAGSPARIVRSDVDPPAGGGIA